MSLATRTHHLKPEGAYQVLARANQLEAAGKEIIHLEIGQPDYATFENISQAGIEAIRAGKTRYTPPAGMPSLREAIAERAGRQRGVELPAPAAPPPVAAPGPAAVAPVAPAETAAGAKHITSPMVGTFYAAPAPDAAPYAKVGQEVVPDTVVCIIEAMKVMNEIKAEVKGVITRVLAENAKPVEFGQKLFEVRAD